MPGTTVIVNDCRRFAGARWRLEPHFARLASKGRIIKGRMGLEDGPII